MCCMPFEWRTCHMHRTWHMQSHPLRVQWARVIALRCVPGIHGLIGRSAAVVEVVFVARLLPQIPGCNASIAIDQLASAQVRTNALGRCLYVAQVRTNASSWTPCSEPPRMGARETMVSYITSYSATKFHSAKFPQRCGKYVAAGAPQFSVSDTDLAVIASQRLGFCCQRCGHASRHCDTAFA